MSGCWLLAKFILGTSGMQNGSASMCLIDIFRWNVSKHPALCSTAPKSLENKKKLPIF